MMLAGLIFISLYLLVTGVLVVAACMRSAQISRRQEN